VCMEGEAGGFLSHLPCRRCFAVSPMPRPRGAGNAHTLQPPWPRSVTTACTHPAVPVCSPGLSSAVLGCAPLSSSHHCRPPAAPPSSLADSSGIPCSPKRLPFGEIAEGEGPQATTPSPPLPSPPMGPPPASCSLADQGRSFPRTAGSPSRAP